MSEIEVLDNVHVQEFEETGTTAISVYEQCLNDVHVEGVKRAVKRICGERIKQGATSFVLDLSGVRVIDSCGLSMLVSVNADLAGARLGLAGLLPAVERLLVITKLDRIFEIYPDVETAVSPLK